jgi:hypothetical protein
MYVNVDTFFTLVYTESYFHHYHLLSHSNLYISIETKLSRNIHFMLLYKVYVIGPDRIYRHLLYINLCNKKTQCAKRGVFLWFK